MNMISVVMVTGGNTGSAQPSSVELLSINGSSLCSLPNLPEARKLHSQSLGIICGGDNSVNVETSCVALFGSSWTRTHTLATPRSGHISWVSPLGVVLMGHHQKPQATTASVLTDAGDSTLPGTLPYQI